jgi:hypothetical protein
MPALARGAPRRQKPWGGPGLGTTVGATTLRGRAREGLPSVRRARACEGAHHRASAHEVRSLPLKNLTTAPPPPPWASPGVQPPLRIVGNDVRTSAARPRRPYGATFSGLTRVLGFARAAVRSAGSAVSSCGRGGVQQRYPASPSRWPALLAVAERLRCRCRGLATCKSPRGLLWCRGSWRRQRLLGGGFTPR